MTTHDGAIKLGQLGVKNAMYEYYSSRVRSVTIAGKDAVYYSVEVLEDNEWVTEWSRTVSFGSAFQEVLFNQDKEAKDWVYVTHPTSLTAGEA
jgi:hypothetical protein